MGGGVPFKVDKIIVLRECIIPICCMFYIVWLQVFV